MSVEIFKENKVIHLIYGEKIDLKLTLQSLDESIFIEKASGKTLHRLYDCRQVTQIEINWDSLKEIFYRLSDSFIELNYKVAFIVSSEEHMKLILAYQTFLMDTEIKIGIFFENKIAVEWLEI